MIGIFDSGVGGFCAFREVRRLLPREDIVYLADRKNAPYGTKTKDEITALTKADINTLLSFGVSKILIACCTASSVYDSLSDREREICLPIIRAAAERAASGRSIAVIATEGTVRSGIFTREIGGLTTSPVVEFPEQRLVALVEGGCRDGRISAECDEELQGIAARVSEAEADTLILGCTHFSHLEGELQKRCRIRTVSPAREGARALVKMIKTDRRECGKNIYLIRN